MISPERENYVRGLIAAGELSRREIARRVGLSRGTVASIAKGGRRRRVQVLVTGDGARRWELDDPPREARCSTCGVRVLMPCLACFLRSIARVFTGKR